MLVNLIRIVLCAGVAAVVLWIALALVPYVFWVLGCLAAVGITTAVTKAFARRLFALNVKALVRR